MYRRLNNNDK